MIVVLMKKIYLGNFINYQMVGRERWRKLGMEDFIGNQNHGKRGNIGK